jgi:hypothetical protein
MGLMSEWKAFASLAVNYLGMPSVAMPFYDSRFKVKGEQILEFVLKTGNFGHNRDAASGKIGSAWLKFRDFARHSLVFPVDSLKFFCHFMVDGIKLAMAK